MWIQRCYLQNIREKKLDRQPSWKGYTNLGLDGLNLDIEGIKSSAGPGSVSSLSELSVACQNAGIILSVDNYVRCCIILFITGQNKGRMVDYYIITGV